MDEGDPWEHLEWDLITKDDLIDHIAHLMENTSWYNNCTYRQGITIQEAMELRVMGQDAGLISAITLCPGGSNFNKWLEYYLYIKGSSNSIHFIFEIFVGKSRIRHRTTLKWNDEILDRLKIDRR